MSPNITSSVLRASAACVLIGAAVLAPCHAAVVAEWDFRANGKLTVAGGTASKDVTFINGGKVNVGSAVGAGDPRMAEGYLQCPWMPFNGSTKYHHGLQTNGVWSDFFGTSSLGEGTLVTVVRYLGNNHTYRKTIFAHELGDAYAEMYLGYYDNHPTNPPALTWRVCAQYSTDRNAVVPVTMEVGAWYLIVGTWKAGTQNQLQVRKIGTNTTYGATSLLNISTTTNNQCNGNLTLGVRTDGTQPAEGADMDIAFMQLSNVRNNDIDSIYNQLLTEPDDSVDAMGLGVTFRQDFPGSYAARVGTMTVDDSLTGPTQNIALAPGLFHLGETVLNSGASIGDRPKQRLLCGTKASIAPNFDLAGTFSFYWSPDFNATDNGGVNTARLWSTNSTGDTATFSGRWVNGNLIANFGLVESQVAMPVVAKKWYLITVGWGRYDKNDAARGRVHWQEVAVGSAVNYPTGGGVIVHGSAGHKLAWGDSQLCVGSSVADQIDSGAKGTIDRVVYQDNVTVRAAGADGMYENTFAKYAANPLVMVTGAQEVQFPSSDVTVRGYPNTALLRQDAQMTNLGTTTSVPGFRQLPNPKKWDYAMKAAANGTTTGIGLDAAKVLPNALKANGTVRLLYKPDLTEGTTGAATLVSAGTVPLASPTPTASPSDKGLRVYRQDQNKVVLTMNTADPAATKTVTLTITDTRNQFTDATSWYYVGAAWVSGTGTSARLRVYVRKVEPGLNPPPGELAFINTALPNQGYTLPSGIRIGSRIENNTENARGAIDEVMFLDGTAWGTTEFDADYNKLRQVNDFYDFRRTADSSNKRVRYIPAEPLMRSGVELATDLMSPAGANRQIGYQIPLEMKTVLNYEPAVLRMKRYFREDVIAKMHATRRIIPTVEVSTIADTSNARRAYQMLQWFDGEEDPKGTSPETYWNYHESAVEILNGAISNFYGAGSGTKAWAWGFTTLSTGLHDYDSIYTASPQSRSYDRFGSSLIVAGLKLGDTAMVTKGENIMRTYNDSIYSTSIPVVPDVLTVTDEQSELTLVDTDALYFTNDAYWAWKESGTTVANRNAVLADVLERISDAWSTHAWVEAWGHSRRKVKVDGTLDTVDILYGDGMWNQLRGMSVGYPISQDSELVRKTEKTVEFLRAASRYGLYPEKVQAGRWDRDTFTDYSFAWGSAQTDVSDPGGDANGISRAGGGFLRDILYAVDATGSDSLQTYGKDLADAMIKAGVFYNSSSEAMNNFPRLAILRGVCRVKVDGDLGDMLKVVRKLTSATVVEKPVAEYDEAVVYLAPGQYEVTASRGGSGTPQAFTASGTSMTVTVDAP